MEHRQGYRPLGNFHVKIDANKNKLCVNCGKIITNKRQRKYCNIDCSNEFFMKNYHSALRTKLIHETNYKCYKCGKKVEYEKNHRGEYGYGLVLDHIKPIALGGAEFDINNLQILCFDCNKVKTAQDMKVIAEYRKREKILKKNQTLKIR